VLEDEKRECSIRDTVDVISASIILFEIGWAVARAELADSTDLPLIVALDTPNDIVGRGLIARPAQEGSSP